jgi:hypothetical protein
MISKKDMNPQESSPVSARTCLQKRSGMRPPWPVMAVFRRREKLRFDLVKRAAGLMVCALLCSAPAFAQESITSFDVPGSLLTLPTSINAAETITGSYIGTDFKFHGFVRDAQGTFTTFDPPPSTGESPIPDSINESGAITGDYVVCSCVGRGCCEIHGFVRDPQGSFTAVDVPGGFATSPRSINERGAITGFYFDGNGNAHAFMRHAQGAFTLFDFPGSVDTVVGTITPAGGDRSLNAAGAITGFYFDADLQSHGFVRETQGAFTSFDAPESFKDTQPTGINAVGEITGWYGTEDFTAHGFVRTRQGAITTVDPPGSTSTFPKSINVAGAITGFYADADFVWHGFVRDAGGAITTFDPPGSVYTEPASINAAGVITGFYYDEDFLLHGFVRQPSAPQP